MQNAVKTGGKKSTSYCGKDSNAVTFCVIFVVKSCGNKVVFMLNRAKYYNVGTLNLVYITNSLFTYELNIISTDCLKNMTWSYELLGRVGGRGQNDHFKNEVTNI